jgi:hypothetical protein
MYMMYLEKLYLRVYKTKKCENLIFGDDLNLIIFQDETLNL